ncbi:hypothetical protein [Pontibacter burrus]|uniref:Uncharacterized protein n=1 Tax=Pontibacter burrus TaxID=2704466 RepID=A0A6B3M114_9BACT|nr:hypothetical protein [Pontibacter burrus]NEM99327.1 hypothetical protein [Pontibacter burrus]
MLENSRAWVRLYSKILERRVHNYRQYFEYAAGLHNPNDSEAAIIEILESYAKGISKSYRFKHPYNSVLMPGEWTITNRALLRSLQRRHQAQMASVVALYPNIVKWFDAKRLKIDSEGAKKYAEVIRKQNQAEVDAYMWDIISTGGAISDEMSKKPDPTLQYVSTLLNIHKIEEGWFFLSVDTNVRRLHSNLTNLKSEIRHFLTYDGKKLVSVDVNNAQPLLSKALFKIDFLADPSTNLNEIIPTDAKEQEQELGMDDTSDGEEQLENINVDYHFETADLAVAEKSLAVERREREFFHLSTVAPEIHTILSIPITKKSKLHKGEKPQTTYLTDIINSLIMFEENSNDYNNVDIVQFFELASAGILYEEFARLMQEAGYEYSSRKHAKLALLLALFTSNSFINSVEAAPKRMFKGIFPSVYRHFTLFKRQDKSILARLLQSIESWLILEQISERLSNEYPDVPIFTVHDSILTTEGNEELVKLIMEEEIEKYLGLKPTLKVELLTPELLLGT